MDTEEVKGESCFKLEHFKLLNSKPRKYFLITMPHNKNA